MLNAVSQQGVRLHLIAALAAAPRTVSARRMDSLALVVAQWSGSVVVPLQDRG